MNTENNNITIKFKKGDVIISEGIEREIVKVYKKDYSWKYPNIDEIFYSENSCDPMLKEWKLKN